MPKLFPIHIEVEEAFVGQVIRRLNAMPGVAKFNFDMMAKRIARAATNGDGTPRKNTGMRFEKTGQEFITGLLAKHFNWEPHYEARCQPKICVPHLKPMAARPNPYHRNCSR